VPPRPIPIRALPQGFLILNGSDPSQILQRSAQPIFSPVLDWEVGNSTVQPFFSLTPNVVFVEGVVPWPGVPDSFLFVYGAADSRVGVGRIDVIVPSASAAGAAAAAAAVA
jgi:predicted GH43/DUF377 family glycosyl hydrolase